MTQRIYKRVDLAIEQLKVALSLFLDEQNFVSALTLAGAAEEILGMALKHSGQKHSLEKWFEPIAKTRKILEGKQPSQKEFFGKKNRARNSVKHMRTTNNTTIEADFEEEAIWMIVRACDNYDQLGYPRTEKIRKFEEWFYENVIGV